MSFFSYIMEVYMKKIIIIDTVLVFVALLALASLIIWMPTLINQIEYFDIYDKVAVVKSCFMTGAMVLTIVINITVSVVHTVSFLKGKK